MRTGTETDPGFPVGVPVTVERREDRLEVELPEPGAEQAEWQERFDALAEAPPQAAISSAQRIAPTAGTAPFHAALVIPGQRIHSRGGA
jgi:hypothetical protein